MAPCSEGAHINIDDELGAIGERLFVSSWCAECLYGAVQSYRCDWMNRAGGAQYPRRQNLNSGTNEQKRGSRPARTRNVRYRAVLSRMSPPVWRACPPTVVCSRVAHTNISNLQSKPSNSRVLESGPHQHLQQLGHNRRTLFRMKLLSGAHLRSCTCVSLRQGEPNRGTSSWIRPTQSGAADRRGRETRGMAPYCRESLPRAGEHALQRSGAREHVHTNIYDEFGTTGGRFFV